VHVTDANGRFSLIAAFAYKNDSEAIDILLSHKADPNSGNPSALSQALHRNNFKIVQKLLKPGADPFLKGINGKIPIIEAILYSSPKILKLLLQGKCNLAITDEEGVSPLLAVLFSGNRVKYQMLKRKNLHLCLPEFWPQEVKNLLNAVVNRYIA